MATMTSAVAAPTSKSFWPIDIRYAQTPSRLVSRVIPPACCRT